MTDMRVPARAYLDAGYQIVPLLPRTKKITDQGWPERVYTLDDVRPDSNLGLKCVPAVVDIDCPLALRCADDFLPTTERIDGRPGKRDSHRSFDTDLKAEDFTDIDSTFSDQRMLVQILSGPGKQAVVPPSLWVNNGHQERRAWRDGSVVGPPASKVEAPFLRSRVVWVATVALIARHWPKKGIRRELRLAYARVLLETLKLDPFIAARILEWACRLGGSDDNGIKHAASAVRDTKDALGRGEHATGAPSVAKLLPEGEKLIARLREWYRLGGATSKRDETVEDLQAFLLRIEAQPVLAWHIDGLIPDEGICLWHGQPRDFKTMCAQETTLALAAGRAAFGSTRFAVRRAVKVAYFTEEDPERLFAARMRWLTAMNPKPGPGFFFPFIRKSLSFDIEEDREFILRKIRETSVEVVAFDPVRSYTGLSDKGPADLRPVAMFLRRIQNETTAKTLLNIHHDTKPLAVAADTARSRSQQASGGGIFSISDCPVSFTKLAWNKVAVFPEDYKLSGDPKPFEVTFETDERVGDDGPRFGSWVRPVAATKEEQDIVDGAAAQKILAFLHATAGVWHSTTEVNTGAKLRKDAAGPVLKQLRAEGLVLYCTGEDAKTQGRKTNAHLWSGVVEERTLLSEHTEF